jgi:hypothetical protein
MGTGTYEVVFKTTLYVPNPARRYSSGLPPLASTPAGRKGTILLRRPSVLDQNTDATRTPQARTALRERLMMRYSSAG